MLHGRLWTVFGWTVRTDTQPNPRFLRNFLMQGNGAELLRLACCLTVETGIRVCAPVHDALLIEAPLEDLDEAVLTAQDLMAEASAIVLDGFRLRTDAEVIRCPDRYQDERGQVMWQTVQMILEELTTAEGCAPMTTPPAHERTTPCARAPTRPILYLSHLEGLQ